MEGRGSLFKFDMFNPDIKLNIAGAAGVSTKVGSILSVIFIALFGGLSFIIVSDYFDTKKPRISQAVVSTELPPVISWAQDKLYPMLVFYYQVSIPIKKPDLDRFVTVEFSKISLERIGDTVQDKTTIKYMKTVACSELVAQGKMKSFVVDTAGERESLLNAGVCVDPEDEDMSLGRKSDSDPFFQQVLWRILPCSLPSGCASREEIAKVTFFPVIPKPIQDLSNHDRPVRYVTLADEVMFLSVAFTNRQTLTLMKTDIIDEAGFLSRDKLTQSYSAIHSISFSLSDRNPSQLSCTSAEISARTCIPYFIQVFMTGP